jgi:hypothetical protein
LAKKSSTIHVENFVWDEIENIQKSQGISSRNTAIEYLVAEYRGLKMQSGKSDIIITDNKEEVEETVKKEPDVLSQRLQESEDNMPD